MKRNKPEERGRCPVCCQRDAITVQLDWLIRDADERQLDRVHISCSKRGYEEYFTPHGVRGPGEQP